MNKNINGSSAVNIYNGNINNLDWKSISAQTVTATGNLFGPNGLDVIEELNNKEDVITPSTNITLNKLIANTVDTTNLNATTVDTTNVNTTNISNDETGEVFLYNSTLTAPTTMVSIGDPADTNTICTMSDTSSYPQFIFQDNGVLNCFNSESEVITHKVSSIANLYLDAANTSSVIIGTNSMTVQRSSPYKIGFNTLAPETGFQISSHIDNFAITNKSICMGHNSALSEEQIKIIANLNEKSALYFCESGSKNDGIIRYNHVNDIMSFYVAGNTVNEAMSLDSLGTLTTNLVSCDDVNAQRLYATTLIDSVLYTGTSMDLTGNIECSTLTVTTGSISLNDLTLTDLEVTGDSVVNNLRVDGHQNSISGLAGVFLGKRFGGNNYNVTVSSGATLKSSLMLATLGTIQTGIIHDPVTGITTWEHSEEPIFTTNNVGMSVKKRFSVQPSIDGGAVATDLGFYAKSLNTLTDMVAEICAKDNTALSRLMFSNAAGSLTIGEIEYDHATKEMSLIANNVRAFVSDGADTTINTNLNVGSDALYVDKTNKYIGVGIIDPQAAMHIQGSRPQMPTEMGVQIGDDGTNQYGISLVGGVNAKQKIDFGVENENFRGRIEYDNALREMEFTAQNGATFTISDNLLDCHDSLIKTTGNIEGDELICNTLSITDINVSNDVTLANDLNIKQSNTTDGSYKQFALNNDVADMLFFKWQTAGVGGVSATSFNAMWLDKTGNLIIPGNFESVNVTSTGNISATGNIVTTAGNCIVDGFIGADETTPESCIHVRGPRNMSLTDKNYGIHLGNGTNGKFGTYGMDFVSNGNSYSEIRFLEPNGVNANYGKISYDNLLATIDFVANGASQMTVKNNEVNMTDCKLITSGKAGFGSQTTPDCALSITGGTGSFINSSNEGVHIGKNSNNNSVISLNASSTGNKGGQIEFINTDNASAVGRILYEFNNNELTFRAASADQMTIKNNEVNMTDCTLITSGKAGFGSQTTPESSVHVTGPRATTPGYGVHLGYGDSATGNYGIELCSDSSGDSVIDFTIPGQNTRGRILYDNTDERFDIRTNNNVTRLSISSTGIDCKNSDITTTGTINGNLNSTRGQLLTYMGEENGQLSITGYDFSYGSAAGSAGTFGMLIPTSVKLKKFCYGNTSGTAPTSSDKVVFQLVVNNTAQNVYCLIRFSEPTNASVSQRRFANKFSSSHTSQVDTEPSYTDSGFGLSLAWRTISSTLNTNVDRHRLSIICETLNDL